MDGTRCVVKLVSNGLQEIDGTRCVVKLVMDCRR